MSQISSSEIVELAQEQGFRIRETKHGYVIYAKDGVHTIGLHKSKPSDFRAHKKRISDLRRIGVEI